MKNQDLSSNMTQMKNIIDTQNKENTTLRERIKEHQEQI